MQYGDLPRSQSADMSKSKRRVTSSAHHQSDKPCGRAYPPSGQDRAADCRTCMLNVKDTHASGQQSLAGQAAAAAAFRAGAHMAALRIVRARCVGASLTARPDLRQSDSVNGHTDNGMRCTMRRQASAAATAALNSAHTRRQTLCAHVDVLRCGKNIAGHQFMESLRIPWHKHWVRGTGADDMRGCPAHWQCRRSASAAARSSGSNTEQCSPKQRSVTTSWQQRPVAAASCGSSAQHRLAVCAAHGLLQGQRRCHRQCLIAGARAAMGHGGAVLGGRARGGSDSPL
ncbi:hypothetical protein JKP88DRAFT_252719 [Tribonema minus]|uniref:Uncharacterized protein n=1 Tax=Tribonema minus TaxID=303371 RepID=A0A835ZCC6_9STRA|nr:hypothetical protein JKP88DRAFT_252719 [Tribonema minus]